MGEDCCTEWIANENPKEMANWKIENSLRLLLFDFCWTKKNTICLPSPHTHTGIINIKKDILLQLNRIFCNDVFAVWSFRGRITRIWNCLGGDVCKRARVCKHWCVTPLTARLMIDRA